MSTKNLGKKSLIGLSLLTAGLAVYTGHGWLLFFVVMFIFVTFLAGVAPGSWW